MPVPSNASRCKFNKRDRVIYTHRHNDIAHNGAIERRNGVCRVNGERIYTFREDGVYRLHRHVHESELRLEVEPT